MVSLDALSGVVAVDEATGEATLFGGTRIRDIAGLLAPWGRALASMGDIDAQSIAGAVSTATHGTGLAFTGYAGQVTGLRLALADGRLVDVRKEFGDEPSDVSAERDGDLFEAARVGLEAFGVITRVTLRTVPAFGLRAVETTEPIEGVLEGVVERARAADHLEFFWSRGRAGPW